MNNVIELNRSRTINYDALALWSNGTDFIVAVSENAAKEFLRQVIGQRAASEGGLDAPEFGWGPVPLETVIIIDAAARTAGQWIRYAGIGYLGSI